MLKNQNRQLQNKMETAAFKIKSSNDLKKELKALFSVSGYSEILKTNSFFKKILSLSCFISFFVTCMVFIDKNLKDYQANEVVTQITVVDNETLIFPAITFCLLELTTLATNPPKNQVISHHLNGLIVSCQFLSVDSACTLADFEYTPMYTDSFLGNTTMSCYTFNGARNSSNLERKIYTTQKIGINSGLSIEFNISKDYQLYYYVGDNSVQPIWSELTNGDEKDRAKNVYVGIKRTVNIKLPEPYSRCLDNINSDTSDLVKEIIEQNMTYRQKYCYELCQSNYLNKYAASPGISVLQVANLNFDYKGNCSDICPLECSSTSFELSKNEVTSNVDSLWMNFFYLERRYTEISESVKTTGADLVSNTGGVLGLFLEISFISAYRLIIYIFDVYFP